MRRAAGVVLAAALAGACATVERVVPIPVLWPPGGVSAAALSEDLIDYIAKARAMNEAALASEAARARQSVAKDPGDLARVKAGIAVSLLPQGDEAEILALVEPVAKRDAPAPVKAMASFLQAQALERRRLRESAASARATLRDERRALETQKQRADNLQERAGALQQKLDALIEHEKSLSDRQSPNPR